MKQMIDEHGQVYEDDSAWDLLPVGLFALAVLILAGYGLYSLTI